MELKITIVDNKELNKSIHHWKIISSERLTFKMNTCLKDKLIYILRFTNSMFQIYVDITLVSIYSKELMLLNRKKHLNFRIWLHFGVMLDKFKIFLENIVGNLERILLHGHGENRIYLMGTLKELIYKL